MKKINLTLNRTWYHMRSSDRSPGKNDNEASSSNNFGIEILKEVGMVASRFMIQTTYYLGLRALPSQVCADLAEFSWAPCPLPALPQPPWPLRLLPGLVLYSLPLSGAPITQGRMALHLMHVSDQTSIFLRKTSPSPITVFIVGFSFPRATSPS